MDGLDRVGARRVARTKVRRGPAALALGLALVAAGVLGALAQDVGTFDGGGRVGGESSITFSSGPYVATRASGKAWSLATGADGKGYFSAYDGAWGDWQAFDDQPADFGWQPAAAEYEDWLYVVYAGEDGKYYLTYHDGEAFTGWEEVVGDHQFGSTPYLNVAAEKLWLYGVAGDGYLYYTAYDGAEWSEWAPVSADYAAEAYESFALEWGGYNNVFWTGTDGLIYWNRYDTEAGEWTGEKALPGEATFAYAPWALAYAPEDRIYAFAVGKDGKPYHNDFAEDEGWTGWVQYDAPVPTDVAYQPNVGVYEDDQHMIFTGTDGHAYYTVYDGEWADSWVDLGDNYAYDPYTYEYDGGFYLTYTGEDGYSYYKEYSADSGY
jgi:hypothetical protein